MSVREILCYTIACDWPGCEVTADDDSDYSCWGDITDAWMSANDADGNRGQGDAWFCAEHRAVWSSDHENDEPYPAPPFLLIHDGHAKFEDGTVSLVEHLHAAEPCVTAATCPHRAIETEAAHYDSLVIAEGVSSS